MQDSTQANLDGALPSGAAKLTSLLALAAGAVALPQTGQADIIYTDLSSSPKLVGWANDASYQFIVPGAANVGFSRAAGSGVTSPGSLTINIRSIYVGGLGPGADAGVRGFATSFAFVAPGAFGATWNQGDASFFNARVGTANDLNQYGGQRPASSYNNRYLAWYFADTTQGNALRYGWVEISLAMAGYNAGGPTVTILRYAYDDTGAKPTMGQMPVPEPTSGALLALGAMALGSRGVRRWRQAQQAANRS